MTTLFGELEALRQRPIPDLTEARARRTNYRAHPIDSAGDLYGEPLTDIATLGVDGENYYHRADNPPYYMRIPGSIDRLLLRRSAAARVAAVDRRLRQSGLRLHVHDALRPVDVQRYFHDVWMAARVREKHPGLSDRDVIVEVEKFWAAPTVSADSPAPHSTGGAMDVTLCWVRSGEPLYMGSIFDDVTVLALTDHFERGEPPSYSDAEARANRRLLYWAMQDGGLANNPSEWWHFSFGDQMWARLTGAPAAHFGPAAWP